MQKKITCNTFCGAGWPGGKKAGCKQPNCCCLTILCSQFSYASSTTNDTSFTSIVLVKISIAKSLSQISSKPEQIKTTNYQWGGCGSGVESCYREVAGLTLLVWMSECPWARCWTPSCSWCAGWHLAWQPPPSVYECMSRFGWKCLLNGLNVNVNVSAWLDTTRWRLEDMWPCNLVEQTSASSWVSWSVTNNTGEFQGSLNVIICLKGCYCKIAAVLSQPFLIELLKVKEIIATCGTPDIFFFLSQLPSCDIYHIYFHFAVPLHKYQMAENHLQARMLHVGAQPYTV